jgi:hypothetical protein
MTIISIDDLVVWFKHVSNELFCLGR